MHTDVFSINHIVIFTWCKNLNFFCSSDKIKMCPTQNVFFFFKWWHTSNNTFYHASIYLKNQALENKTKHQNGDSWPCQWVSAWHSAASPSGLGENNRKRHTRTEKAPGKKTKDSLTHTHCGSSQTCKECRPTGNMQPNRMRFPWLG